MLEKTKEIVHSGYWGYSFKGTDIPLIVIFSFRDLAKNKVAHFSSFRNSSSNLLFLNAQDNTWYQNGIEGLGDTHEETISTLKEIIKEFKPSYTTFFGFSMGGYGSLLYSCFLNPDKVVSLSPELELMLDFSRSNENLQGKPLLKYDLLEELPKKYNGDLQIIFGDMDPMELYFAYKYKDIVKDNVTFIKGCSHYVTTFLAYLKEFTNLVKTLPKTDSYVLPEHFKMIENDKFTFEEVSTLFEAVNQYKYKNYESSIEMYNKIETSFDSWGPFWWHRGRSYIRLKKYELAKKDFERALALHSDNFYFLFDYANTLRLLNNLDESKEIFKQIDAKPLVGHRAKKMIERINVSIDNSETK